MKKSPVASISIPLPSLFTYLVYIALGCFAGYTAIYLLQDKVSPLFAFLGFNLLFYAFAVFAHFRFAHGFSSWPKLEFGNLADTITWSLLAIVAGYFAIALVGDAWSRAIGGIDDARHLRPEGYVNLTAHYVGKPTAIIIAVFDGCIVAPIAEEILFRSGLYRLLKGRFPVSFATGTSAVVFASAHTSVSAFVPLVVLGYLSCWIYEKTGDIRGPIFFHAGFNLLVTFVAMRAQG